MRLWYRIITIVLTLVLTLPMLASCGNPTVIPETEKPPTFTPTIPPFKADYLLLVMVLPPGTGSVARAPNDLRHEEGTRVTLTAIPTSGYAFDHWSGDASDSSATIIITMDLSKGVTAHFIPIPIPAEFTVTNLVISPDDVEKGQPVTISATVTNSGGSPDSYTAILKINGSQVETKSITLNAGDNQVVSFTVVKESAGTYTIELGGLVGTFTVTPAPARFVLGELTITPTNAKTGELITISIPISNTGGTEGTYPLVLKLNGAVDATKNVTLNAGETKTVTFTVTKDIAGAYIVDINGKLSQVNVTTPVPVEPPPTGIDWPSGATALCRDGTFSYSQNRRGTCSWHGGVARWR